MRTAAPILIALLAIGCTPRISEQDLVARVENSEVRWNNYQEDIKAQIGASPVAEWSGAPASASRERNEVRIAFALNEPWLSRSVAMPVLARDPLGNILRESRASQTSTGVEYIFELDASWTDSPVPWVELQFPGSEIRVVFREDGTWQSHR